MKRNSGASEGDLKVKKKKKIVYSSDEESSDEGPQEATPNAEVKEKAVPEPSNAADTEMEQKEDKPKPEPSEDDMVTSTNVESTAQGDAASDSDDEDEEDVPLAKKLKEISSSTTTTTTTAAATSTAKKTKKKRKIEVEPKKGKKAANNNKQKQKAKAGNGTEASQNPASSEAEAEAEEEEEFKWWEDAELIHSKVKWNSLQHSGVHFPKEYEPINVPLIYDGKELKLSKEAEEVAGFFGQMLKTQYVENEVFCRNFFEDFRDTLKEFDKENYKIVKEFSKCDFSRLYDYYEAERLRKKNMTKEEKLILKEEKLALEEKYGFAIVDGRKEKVGNFRIEPPGLFRGRGDHPKTGRLKKRVYPEDITINIGEKDPVPPPPAGHKWGNIVHLNEVGWLATWTENVNGNIKYVMFAATSTFKGLSDFKKFEKARELKKHIAIIRENYTRELKDKVMAVRQRATAMYLIDKLALRAGNEKGDDEADTVGCCSLRMEHVQLEEEEANAENGTSTEPESSQTENGTVAASQGAETRKFVIFDFLGKDSIRYYNKVEVDPVIWKNLKIFKRPPKKDGDPIFDRLSTLTVNKYLNSLMPGLSAKVFRTHNASVTFQEELKKTPMEGTVAEKVLAYNRANRQVAILCNHQRTVSKAHGTQMEKLDGKINALKYERMLIRKALLDADPKLKKKQPELLEDESDLDEEMIEKKSEELKELEREKLEKRYEKMCEKAKAAGEEDPEKPTVVYLEDKISSLSVEKLEQRLISIDEKIIAAKTQKTDKVKLLSTASTEFFRTRIRLQHWELPKSITLIPE